MNILGLSFFYHDAAAVLLRDGIPVAMAEEERFSKKKHDSGFPEQAIRFVLDTAKIRAENLDLVVFYEKPFLKFERVFKMNFATFPAAPEAFAESTKNLFLEKIWIRPLIAKKLCIDREKIFFSGHHLSHAASAFFSSPFEKAAILSIDGVGEWATTAIAIGNGHTIDILKEIHFPHSLGLLYSAFTAFLGFEVNEGEYKVMGMAPYGTPVYAKEVKDMIDFFEDGSYALDLDYFSFHKSVQRSFSKKFIDVFGLPRDPQSKFFTRTTGWPFYFGEKPESRVYEKMALEQEHYADIASSVQAVLEEAVIRLANHARELTGADSLCIAGGVGLNSAANWKIVQNTSFKNIFIQPAAGDAGGALGAALAAYHIGFGKERKFTMRHAYYGKEYSDETIETFLKDKNIEYSHYEKEEELVLAVAREIAEGKVVGWFQGKFEWGPRALGNRSILADPRRADMKNIINTKIKFREPYRPFAPSVLASHAEEFFEIPDASTHIPARFMLYVVKVREEKRRVIPAVTHVDGTARPQIVFKEESPRFHRLIETFYGITGVPLLLNTSFNLKGEPIVDSPEDAISTFERSGLDVLIMGSFLISRRGE